MTIYEPVRNLHNKIELKVKRSQLAGILVSMLTLLITVVFLVLDVKSISITFIIITLILLIFSLTALPKVMNKELKKLLVVSPFLKVDDEQISHGGIFINWDSITAVLRVSSVSQMENNFPFRRGDNVYVVTSKESSSYFKNYSPFTCTYKNTEVLRLRLSYFESPEIMLRDLMQKALDKNIKVLETSNVKECTEHISKRG